MILTILFISLFVCEQDYANTTGRKFVKKDQDPTYIPLNFETDLDHCLDIKKNLDIPIYLLLCDLAVVCAIQVV